MTMLLQLLLILLFLTHSHMTSAAPSSSHMTVSSSDSHSDSSSTSRTSSHCSVTKPPEGWYEKNIGKWPPQIETRPCQPLSTTPQPTEDLVIQLLISLPSVISADPSITGLETADFSVSFNEWKERVVTFLIHFRLKNFPSDTLPQPYWYLSFSDANVYDAAHSWPTDPLKWRVSPPRPRKDPAGFHDLIEWVKLLTPTHFELRLKQNANPSGQRERTTPSLIYRKLTRFINEQASADSIFHTHPPIHIHYVVLDHFAEPKEYFFDGSPELTIEEQNEAMTDLNQKLSQFMNHLTSPELSGLSTSFSIFFPSKLPLYNLSLGSPHHTQSYEQDSSHFNPAGTLRSLIRDKPTPDGSLFGQDSSLSAQLLSRGWMIRTYDIAELIVSSGERVPAHIWEEHYRHPRLIQPWCSACDRWTCEQTKGWIQTPIECPNGEICSSLFGCHQPLPKGSLAKKNSKIETSTTNSTLPITLDTTEIEVDLISVDASAVNDANAFTSITSPTNSTNDLSSILAGAPFPLFHTRPYLEGSRRWTRDHLLSSTMVLDDEEENGVDSSSASVPSPSPRLWHKIRTREWTTTSPFTTHMIQGGRPCLLKKTIVSTWPALKKWNGEYLRQHLEDANITLERTKISRGGSHKFFDPDLRTPLSIPELVNLTMTYDERDLRPTELFEHVTKNWTIEMGPESSSAINKTKTVPAFNDYIPPSTDPLYYYFGAIPSSLLPDVTPYSYLFDSEEDLVKRKMFLWFSSANVNMHTHIDSDHNFFVQLVGIKRFTLFMPESWSEMYMFPRIHPLWHKSQVDFDQPDLERFPGYKKLKAYLVEVHPGDVLYIPPFTWHHVETVTPSVSLSIWSHDTSTLELMEPIYRHDHKVDLLASTEGRTYAVRLYIDLMIHELYGKNATTKWVHSLIAQRYQSLQDIFREEASDDDIDGRQKPICPADKIPTAQHVYGDAMLDMRMMSAHFDLLEPASTRDLLFTEYVEELVAPIVGPTRVLRFWMECFQGQGYRVTEMGTDEHTRLWPHVVGVQ